MANIKMIREKIRKNVKDFYEQSSASRQGFLPGKSRVNYAGRVYDHKELANIVDASLDFWLTSGEYAKRFESNLSKLLGVKYCMLTNSGSSANLLAISALTSPLLGKRQLRPGDEVITVACAFPTTVNPIIQNRLVPVFIDINLETYNIEVEKIKKAITKKTKAIFIAHTLGNPADIDEVIKIARKHNLYFIEDNCDSLGSTYKGKYTGSFGHISTCSFYPAHIITMGEGGALLTDDPLLRKVILSLRDWGRDCWCETGHDNSCGKRFSQKHGMLPKGYDHKFVYSHIGYNLKVTDMQAAIGVAQLNKLKRFINTRRKNFSYLCKHLKKYERYLKLSETQAGSRPAWFGLPILVDKRAPFTRKDIIGFLEKNKVATRMLFGGNITKQPAYRGVRYKVSGGLKNTDLVMNNLFWIGVYPGIGDRELKYICSVFDRFFKEKGK
ncbi:lipopolysaccharide biosynthesis protein RfbH [Candidatus Omnitrophota bacterium]